MEWLPTIRYPYKSVEAQESKGSVKLNYRDLVVFVQALIYDVLPCILFLCTKTKLLSIYYSCLEVTMLYVWVRFLLLPELDAAVAEDV